MIHALKIDPEYYEAIQNGKKRFEIRRNDRNFRVGDYLALNELDDTRTKYTGRSLIVKVTYMLSNENYLQPGFVAMGIALYSRRAEKIVRESGFVSTTIDSVKTSIAGIELEAQGGTDKSDL